MSSALARLFLRVFVWVCLALSGAVGAADLSQLSNRTQQWVEQNPTITYVVFRNHYPYSFINDSGEVDGVVRSFTDDFTERYGIDVQFKIVTSYAEAKQALKDKQADVFPFQHAMPNSGSEWFVTQPYFPYQAALIIPENNFLSHAVRGDRPKKVAYIEQSMQLPQNGFQKKVAEGYPYPTVIDALRALEKGYVDAIWSEPVSTLELAQQSGIEDLTTLYFLSVWEQLQASMLIERSKPELLELHNHQFEQLSSEWRNDVRSAWLGESPFRPKLKGVFGFGNPPYMYPDSPSVGLEHGIIQLLVNRMGYQLGDVVTLPPAAANKALKADDSFSFVSSISDVEDNRRFLTKPIIDIEFVPVTLSGRNLNIVSQTDLKLGALLYDETSPSKRALEDLITKIDVAEVIDVNTLETAFSQLRTLDIDVLLIEHRVLEWFLSNTGYIESSQLKLHTDLAIKSPIRAEFKTEQLRDDFNAALDSIRANGNEMDGLIARYIEKDLTKTLTKAEIIAQVMAYFIVNDRTEDIESVLELFDSQTSFKQVHFESDTAGESRLTWLLDKSMGRKTLSDKSRYASVTKSAYYETKGGRTYVGEVNFHFDVRDLVEKHTYFPSVEQFAIFGPNAQRYVEELYTSKNLTGEILNLSNSERQWIKQQPRLRIGVDPNAMPYEAINEKGEYVGIVEDYLNLIRAKTGLSITAVSVDSWEETIKLADHGTVELISAAIENETLGENYRVARGLFSSRLAVASKRDVRSLVLENATGWKIGILKNGSNTPDITRRHPNVEWVKVNSTEEGLSQVEDGELDGMIDTVHVINYLINSAGYSDIRIVGRLTESVTPSLHVIKSEPLLLSILNKAIYSISAEEHQQIASKWTTPRNIETIDYKLVYLISGFSLLIMVLIFVWNRQLKRQVAIANQATEQLVQARNELYDILNTSPIAASVVIDDRVEYVNDTARLLFVLQDEDMSSFDVTRIYVSLDDRAEVFNTLTKQNFVVNKELKLLKSTGEPFTALVSYYKLVVEGKPATLFWAFDISEMKSLNDQLELEKDRADAASQSKSEFLANMSHEIRTPMNAIIGLSHLAIGEIANPIAKSYVEKVHRSAQSLLNIINDILDFSKIEAGQLGLESIPFDMSETLAEVIELMQVKADEKALELKVVLDSGLSTPVVGDSLRLFQIVLNLVGNAVKFTPQGYVELKAKVVSNSNSEMSVLIAVTDSGIGISQQNIDALFEAFSQADSTTTRKFGGTGLGLNISQKLVSAMGGNITVTSELEYGSCFSFELTLPKANEQEALALKEQSAPREQQVMFAGEKVLLVEDNELNQDLALALLTKLNLNADIANDGLEALEKVKAHQYAVILMDLQMPNLDGFEATKQIRASGNETPIIAMSANVFSEVKEKTLDVGMNGFIEKPILFEQFVIKLSEFIEPQREPSSIVLSESSVMEGAEQTRKKSQSLAVFSQTSLDLFTQGDIHLQQKLLSKFIQQAPTLLTEALQQQEEYDFASLERTLHTLKGIAGSIGGEQLANLMKKLEQQAKEQSVERAELEYALVDLNDLIAHVEPLLNKEETNSSPSRGSILQSDWENIKAKIESFDGEAIKVVNDLNSNQPYIGMLNNVVLALEKYDFELALEELEKVEKE